jgi:calcineurin-like phosphoesterase family protein
MKLFLTGNLQFGRPSAIKQFKRPFTSVEEMNETLIENWNSVVNTEDVVYVLGNFAWDPTTAEETLQKLNGLIVIVPGETDGPIEEIEARKIMPSNAKLIEGIFTAEADKITVSYWPLQEWPNKSKGHYSFFGYPSPKYKTDHKKKMVNVACDFWGYKPQALSSIMSLFDDIQDIDVEKK